MSYRLLIQEIGLRNHFVMEYETLAAFFRDDENVNLGGIIIPVFRTLTS